MSFFLGVPNQVEAGAGHYSRHFNPPDWTSVDDMTICIWFNSPDIDAPPSNILLRALNEAEDTNMFSIRIGGYDSNADWWCRYAGSDAISGIQENRWHHLACFRDASEGTGWAYLDGEEVGSVGQNGNAVGTMSFYHMGQFEPYGAYNGSTAGCAFIEDVRFYNRLLTQNEVKIIVKERGKDGITNGLWGRWLLDDYPLGTVINDDSAVATDYSGNGRDGTHLSPTDDANYQQYDGGYWGPTNLDLAEEKVDDVDNVVPVTTTATNWGLEISGAGNANVNGDLCMQGVTVYNGQLFV